MAKKIFLSLGSNLGDRISNLDNAIAILAKSGIKTVQKSHIYETEPWGSANQPWFLNQCVEVKTDFSPQELIIKLLKIEESMGRRRDEADQYGPREIDIDILMYGKEKISTQNLTVPHPRMIKRKFVLLPLAEIAPEEFHQLFGKTIREASLECNDSSQINVLQNTDQVL